MKCNICSTTNNSCFKSIILQKYNIDYFNCKKCGFTQTEAPYWLDEAYSESINKSDTGYMVRNITYANRLTILLYFLFGKHGNFLDYAGGYGVFVRIMRDLGFNFFWDDKYTKNLFSPGFEWNKTSKIDAITLFEAFEHFTDPIKEIEDLLKISNTLIFSTELMPPTLQKPEEWWYYGLDHGQHISFFSVKTFEYIAKKFNLNYYNLGALHVLSKDTIPSWKIKSMVLVRLGLHNLIRKKLHSKTWDDYHLITNASK